MRNGIVERRTSNYEKTLSSAAMIKFIRILVAIATYLNYKISQMDVKTAFLNGYLEMEIYMDSPRVSYSRLIRIRYVSIVGLLRA